MDESQLAPGELLLRLAALERGQAEPVVVAVDVGEAVPNHARGSIATLALVGGRTVVVPLVVSDAGLEAAVSGALGPVAPRVWTPKRFPKEPITPREKWVELLDDLGGWYEMLGRVRPGLRLVSIRRDVELRAGAVARVTVTDGRRSAVTEVPLDDGLLVVGLPDDLATSFDALATPDPLDS